MDFLRLTGSSIKNQKVKKEDYLTEDSTANQKREADLLQSFFDTVKESAGRNNSQSFDETLSFNKTADYINKTQNALSQMQSILDDEEAETGADKTVNTTLKSLNTLIYENVDFQTDRALSADTKSLISQIRAAAKEDDERRAKNSSNNKSLTYSDTNSDLTLSTDVKSLLAQIRAAAVEEDKQNAENLKKTAELKKQNQTTSASSAKKTSTSSTKSSNSTKSSSKTTAQIKNDIKAISSQFKKIDKDSTTAETDIINIVINNYNGDNFNWAETTNTLMSVINIRQDLSQNVESLDPTSSTYTNDLKNAVNNSRKQIAQALGLNPNKLTEKQSNIVATILDTLNENIAEITSLAALELKSGTIDIQCATYITEAFESVYNGSHTEYLNEKYTKIFNTESAKLKANLEKQLAQLDMTSATYEADRLSLMINYSTGMEALANNYNIFGGYTGMIAQQEFADERTARLNETISQISEQQSKKSK